LKVTLSCRYHPTRLEKTIRILMRLRGPAFKAFCRD
jgi:hypothetical protein